MRAALPETLVVHTALGPATISLVGPSLWGQVYRSRDSGEYFRVLTQEEAPPVATSAAVRAVGDPPKKGLAAIAEVRHSLDVDLTVFFIRYAISRGSTLAESGRAGTLSDQLRRVARVAAALPDWWKATGRAALPMPADVVLTEDGEAVLLPVPLPPAPDVESLLACPARARYIASERLRDADVPSDDADDLHAVGAMLVELFHELPERSAEESLLRAANRTLFSADSMRSALPAWKDRIEAVQQARAEGLRLVNAPAAERARVDPLDLGSRIAMWARNSDPVGAVDSLREHGRTQEALALLNDVLQREESIDLLMKAAHFANEHGELLPAVEYLERVIALRPAFIDAYAIQLDLISRLLDRPLAGSEERSRHIDVIERLDALLWRNFTVLPAEVQGRYESVASRALLRRARYRQAVNFIFPKLHDAQGKHLWWKFDLSLDYAEALMGLNALKEAAESLRSSKQGLLLVKKNSSLERGEIHRIGGRLADLELRLARVQGQIS